MNEHFAKNRSFWSRFPIAEIPPKAKERLEPNIIKPILSVINQFLASINANPSLTRRNRNKSLASCQIHQSFCLNRLASIQGHPSHRINRSQGPGKRRPSRLDGLISHELEPEWVGCDFCLKAWEEKERRLASRSGRTPHIGTKEENCLSECHGISPRLSQLRSSRVER